MNLKDVFSQHGVEFREHGDHRHVSNGYVGVDCPLCGKGSFSFKLGWNLRSLTCTCWACGPQNRVRMLAEVCSIQLREAFVLIGSADLEAYEHVEQTHHTFRAPAGVEPMMRQHREYLEGRGFDPGEIARLWGVQGIGRASQLSWRLYIPIEFRGHHASWTTRSIDPASPMRYMTAKADQEKYAAKSLLYGEDHVGHAVIIHEGPLDVWKTGYGAVATMGMAYTRQQLYRMAKFPKRVVCFDSTPDAQRRARSLCQQLACLDGETFNVTLEAKDAAEASQCELDQLRGMIR